MSSSAKPSTALLFTGSTYDKKSSVYAYKEALDAWRIEREKNLEVVAPPPVPAPEGEVAGDEKPTSLPRSATPRRRQIMSIFTKQVDADKIVRLTQSMRDAFPQWSPDGQLISFYRPPEMMVIPAIGGREAKLGEINFGGIGHAQTWSGDSKGIIVADRNLGAGGSLWFLPLDMSGRIRITTPTAVRGI